MQTQRRRAAEAVERAASDSDALINSAEARALAGGVSDMTLWRWLQRGIIPRPLVIERRRYWKRGEYMAALQAAGAKGMAGA